jgi:hypothetical protein
MLNNEKDGLAIFEGFHHLPFENDNNLTINSSGPIRISNSLFNPISVQFEEIPKPTGFKDTILNIFKRKPKEKPVQQFFKEIKDSCLSLNSTELLTQKNNVMKLTEKLKETHFEALQEKLQQQEKRIESETAMLSEGFPIFVEEQDVVNFSKNISRKVKLDWIKNFVRLIPDEVIKEYKRAKRKKLFQNYVIMHYDPDDKSTALTKEEEEAKKDPILFGVNSFSRRLYFIGDWVDQYCDLTLTKLIEEIGTRPEEHVLTVSKIVEGEGIGR